MTEKPKIDKLLENIWTLRRKGKYGEVQLHLKDAERLCKEDYYNSLGRIFHIYMQVESDHDRYLKALELCKKSLSYYMKCDNLDKIAHSTRHVADMEFQL